MKYFVVEAGGMRQNAEEIPGGTFDSPEAAVLAAANDFWCRGRDSWISTDWPYHFVVIDNAGVAFGYLVNIRFVDPTFTATHDPRIYG